MEQSLRPFLPFHENVVAGHYGVAKTVLAVTQVINENILRAIIEDIIFLTLGQSNTWSLRRIIFAVENPSSAFPRSRYRHAILQHTERKEKNHT